MIHTLHKLTDPIVLNQKSENEGTSIEEKDSEMDSGTESGKEEEEKEYKADKEYFEEGDLEEDEKEAREWARKIRYLLVSFASSSAILFATYFIPVLGNMPVMTWIGLPSVTMFSWTITPSLSYVGQGMIMGPKTGVSMILGALFGWGILAPIARHKGNPPPPPKFNLIYC